MGRNKNKGLLADAYYMNDISYLYFYNWLKLIALNVIKWENLPSTIDVRFLELTLFERGIAVYFNDEVLKKDLVLPVNLTGKYDVYGIPSEYSAFATNGYSYKGLNEDNSVLIYNNYLMSPTELTVRIYARKLMNLSRSIDVNVSAQRTPVMVKCSDSQANTMKALILQYDGNTPFIFVDSKYNMENMEVLNTVAPYVADKLEALFHSTLNDFLVKLGVENSNEDKKERMVSDEVQSNYGIVEVDRNIMLTPRQNAVDRINEILGTDIKVSFNSDVHTLVNAFKGENNIGEEGAEIG